MRKPGLDLDRALEVHLDLIQFFRDGNSTTAAEVARRYGVSQRTAERYLARIDVLFCPLTKHGATWRRAVLR